MNGIQYAYEKIVVVTRKTRLDELTARFNTRAQARFYIEHAGLDFSDYEREDEAYRQSLSRLRSGLNLGLKIQFVDRQYLPTMRFHANEIIVALGQDGLVANLAKYAGGQPIVGVNPDPGRFDGVLVPLAVTDAESAVKAAVAGKARLRSATLAEAVLNDGQRLLAFNDLFIGARSHVSARYRIHFGGKSESQSSSGLIVSTGAGSTGWLSSVFNMVSSVSLFMGGPPTTPIRLDWEADALAFVVREPFVSRHSSSEIAAGLIGRGEELVIESAMPAGGAIFSDGIESDFLAFDAGAVAHVHPSSVRANLVVGS